MKLELSELIKSYNSRYGRGEARYKEYEQEALEAFPTLIHWAYTAREMLELIDRMNDGNGIILSGPQKVKLKSLLTLVEK